MCNVPFPLNACTTMYLVGVLLTLISGWIPNLQLRSQWCFGRWTGSGAVEELVVESAHPYTSRCFTLHLPWARYLCSNPVCCSDRKTSWQEVTIKGAESLEVTFDLQSRMYDSHILFGDREAKERDRHSFYLLKSKWSSDYDSGQVPPAKNGVRTWIVKGDSFWWKNGGSSGNSDNSFGWKFTVKDQSVVIDACHHSLTMQLFNAARSSCSAGTSRTA